MDDLELYYEQYKKDVEEAKKICDEIDYKIRHIGNLTSPTIDVVKDVVRECTNVDDKTGFLFFLRAFGWVPHPTKGKIRLGNNNGESGLYNWQLVASIKFLKYTKFISKKVRQVGATTFVSTYFLWRALFYGNTNSFILSLGARESSDVLSRVTFMYNNLPVWLKTPLLEGAKTSIKFKNNSSVTALPGTPEALRGRSSSCVILDEFAFLQKADRIISSAVPSLSMGFLTPFTNSTLPSQLFIISTFPLVESDANEYVRLYRGALNRESDLTMLDIHTDDVPEYNDERWLKSMLDTLGQKRFNIEIKGIMNTSMDNSFFPEYIIAELRATQPLRTDFLNPNDVDEEGFPINIDTMINAKENYDPSIGYIKGLWIWRDPLPKKEYGVTVDVAAGVGSDYSAIQVIDLEEGEQVAEYYSNKVSLEDFKSVIKDITFYYNNAKLSIERNSLGAPLCSFFYESVKYDNFYIHRKSKNSFVEGFPVTGGNRGSMLANLQSALIKKEIKINSIRTINEIRTFAFLGNGKLGASQGSHDDLIMALAQYSYLREIFFNTQVVSDYGDEFMMRVDKEAERIKNQHFSNGVWGSGDDKEKELKNLFAGYSVDPISLQQWREIHGDL
jgi:hypothetical protein